MKTTFKDFAIEEMNSMGIENSECKTGDTQDMFDRFDDYLNLLDKSEIIEIIKDYNEL